MHSRTDIDTSSATDPVDRLHHMQIWTFSKEEMQSNPTQDSLNFNLANKNLIYLGEKLSGEASIAYSLSTKWYT